MRELCIHSGIEVLRDLGLTVGLTGVTIEAAASRSGFSRASAYRAWRDDDSGDGPQQRFQRAVMIQLLSSIADSETTVANRVFAMLAAETGTDDPESMLRYISSADDNRRERLFAKVVATGTYAHTGDLVNNSLWHTQISLVASLNSHDAPPPDLRSALRDGETVTATMWIDFYQLMLGAFGLRLKPHYSWEQVARAAAAVGEGVALRGRDPDGQRVDRPIRTDSGALEVDPHTPWTLFGVALMGIVVEFCEPDPAVPHAIDPRRC